MKVKIKINQTIALLMLVFAVISCASFNQLTPQQTYLAAVTTFNNNLAQYNAVFKTASPSTQDKWRTEINPIIEATSAALDLWGTEVTNTAYENDYRNLLRQFLFLLITNKIIEVETN